MIRFLAATAFVAAISGSGVAQDAPGTSFNLPPDGNLSMSSTALWPHYIEPATEHATLMTGRIAVGAPIISVPYRYSHPLRLSKAVHTLFKTIPAGAPGFDAGDFDGALGSEHLVCFFRPDSPDGYGLPECLRQVDKMGIGWASAEVGSNLPLYYTAGSPAGTPEVDKGTPIDHDFRLVFVVKGWKKKTVQVTWLSDGRSPGGGTEVDIGADGKATLQIIAGILTLSPDPGDKNVVIVGFTPKVGVTTP